RTFKEEVIFQTPRQVEVVAFSPDGSALSAGLADGTIITWDLRTRKVRTTLKGYSYVVTALHYHPTEKVLFSAGWNTEKVPNRILAWDVETGKVKAETKEIRGPSSLALTPDGSQLIACGSGIREVGELRFLTTDLKKELLRLEGHQAEVVS